MEDKYYLNCFNYREKNDIEYCRGLERMYCKALGSKRCRFFMTVEERAKRDEKYGKYKKKKEKTAEE